MNIDTKRLSPQALEVIDGYSNIPYFNNKIVQARMSLRARAGKGSPKDIFDELQTIVKKHHIDASTLSDESRKKLLVDNNLGVDCSALAYHALDAESRGRGQGHLNRHLTFMTGRNPMTKMLSYLRPVENCNVKTFASDTNSRVIALKEVRPGDFITMLGGPDNVDRDHILLIHEAEYAGESPVSIHYSHAVAYPKDGLYGTGLKRGKIDIANPEQGFTKQSWPEDGSAQKAEGILKRAHDSKTELRRLKWLS